MPGQFWGGSLRWPREVSDRALGLHATSSARIRMVLTGGGESPPIYECAWSQRGFRPGFDFAYIIEKKNGGEKPDSTWAIAGPPSLYRTDQEHIMATLTWDESMSTGLPQLDAHHREIFAKYNELSEALTRSGGASRAATSELLDFLQFYAAWHFEREEACMEHYGCPVAEANRRAHAYFITVFGQLYEQWQETDTDMALVRQTYAELGDWIANHIRRIDTQLAPCVNESGGQAADGIIGEYSG
jgi:hemerythrin